MIEATEASRLYAAGDFPAAEDKLRTALARDPSFGPARVMLGVIYAKTRRYPLAIETLESVLADYPEQFDSIFWLATVKKLIGDYEEAIALCERAIALKPDDPMAYNTLGLCCLSCRRTDQALTAFRRAIELAPESAPSHHNLGLALRLRDEPFEACQAFQRAIDLDPTNEANYIQLYRQHLLLSAFHDTILNLEAGLKQLPTSIPIQDALALSYCRTRQKDRGEALFRRVLDQKQGFCHSYSLWLQEEGRFEESIALLQRWIEIEPIQGVAYFCLAEAKAFRLDDGSTLTERGADVLDKPRLKPLDRMYLSYALGKAHEQAKEFEKAMTHFNRANELAFRIFNDGRRLDYEVTRTTNDCLMELYSREFLAQYRSYGSPSRTPILILGMIRSGTTLLDQIISSHMMVASAGEQPFWKLDGSRVTHAWHNHGVDVADFGHLRDNYLAILKAFAGGSHRITDKQPLNYEMLGLIHAVFPRAKIVHVRRNPIDTCVSMYTTHFGGGPNFAYKQENIVHHYREYHRLMEHWRSVLPEGSFFELDYEDLVTDTERVVREIIDFCGLPWDDGCLHHEEKQSTVTTPSRWQARQPIYTSSVAKWRNYEPWLGGLLELKDLEHPAPRRMATHV